METPTMQSAQTVSGSKNNIPMIIAVVAIVAIAIWLLAKPKMDTVKPADQLTDSETSVVQQQATQNFSSADDTNALEADLNASMGDFK